MHLSQRINDKLVFKFKKKEIRQYEFDKIFIKIIFFLMKKQFGIYGICESTIVNYYLRIILFLLVLNRVQMVEFLKNNCKISFKKK